MVYWLTLITSFIGGVCASLIGQLIYSKCKKARKRKKGEYVTVTVTSGAVNIEAALAKSVDMKSIYSLMKEILRPEIEETRTIPLFWLRQSKSKS